jgi:hypothetical protein
VYSCVFMLFMTVIGLELHLLKYHEGMGNKNKDFEC